MIRRSFAVLFLTLATAGVGGCAGIRDHRGYVIEKSLAGAIQPGVDNRDSVMKTLGRPTFAGQFADNDWYYVSRDTNQFGFRNARVRGQTVIHVHFDPAGNVASVDSSGKEKIASIRPLHQSTPTLGRKRSFFDEVFGNIGVVGAGAPGAGTGAGNPGQ